MAQYVFDTNVLCREVVLKYKITTKSGYGRLPIYILQIVGIVFDK